jgi:CubicO group peptidase (beta-lactamase class C family)
VFTATLRRAAGAGDRRAAPSHSARHVRRAAAGRRDARPGRPPDRRPVEAWLDGFMPYALEQTDVAGAVVVVVKDGKVLLKKGYGFSDVAKRTPVDPDKTLFRPGSISKLFTWTAVMQLVEQGKLDLDADVNQYLDFKIPPYEGKPVTLRNIMTHTTGFEEVIRGLIANNERRSCRSTRRSSTGSRAHLRAGHHARLFQLRHRLAGYIVQRVSGQPFDQYIAQHIFAPLGMQHSSFSQPVQKKLLDDVEGLRAGVRRQGQALRVHQPRTGRQPDGDRRDMGNFMIAHLQNGAFDGSASCARTPRTRCTTPDRPRSVRSTA